MNFYTKQHKYYCGVDLHARSIYLCILNQNSDILYHRNIRADAEQFLKAVGPYREDLAIAVVYSVGIGLLICAPKSSLHLYWAMPST